MGNKKGYGQSVKRKLGIFAHLGSRGVLRGDGASEHPSTEVQSSCSLHLLTQACVVINFDRSTVKRALDTQKQNIATSGFLTALEYTKLVFGRETPLGSLQRSPDPLTGLTSSDVTREGGGRTASGDTLQG